MISPTTVSCESALTCSKPTCIVCFGNSSGLKDVTPLGILKDSLIISVSWLIRTSTSLVLPVVSAGFPSFMYIPLTIIDSSVTLTTLPVNSLISILSFLNQIRPTMTTSTSKLNNTDFLYMILFKNYQHAYIFINDI